MGSQSSTSRHHGFNDAHRSGIPGLGPLPIRDLGIEDMLLLAGPPHSPDLTNPSAPTSSPDDDLVGEEPALAKQPLDKLDDLIPCVFTWTQGGHVVYLTGSFNGWSVKNKICLNRSGHEFSSIRNLPRGVHYYKFIVDDQWKYATDQMTLSDEHGNINNVLDISGFRHIQYKGISEVEQARNDVYHQCVPEPSEYSSDAPVLPILLNKSTNSTADPPPRNDIPVHCLANHLFHDAHTPLIFGSHISCIACTQRWRIDNAKPTSGQRYATYIYLTVNPLYPFSPPGESDYEVDVSGESKGSVNYLNPLKGLLVSPSDLSARDEEISPDLAFSLVDSAGFSLSVTNDENGKRLDGS